MPEKARQMVYGAATRCKAKTALSIITWFVPTAERFLMSAAIKSRH